MPTLKPASRRDPQPFHEVEVPQDKLDVVAKMVDGVFQVLPVQMFQRVDSSDSMDKHSSLYVETGGHEFQPPKEPVTPQVFRGGMKREGQQRTAPPAYPP